MKKLFTALRGKIRVKLLCAILLILAFFILLITRISSPLLFRAFTRNTYNKLCELTEAVNLCVPDSGAYYFDLYALSQNYGINFEIVGADGSLLYRSSGSSSAIGSDHFPSSGTTKPEYDNMVDSVNYDTSRYNYRNFEIKKRLATNADYFVYHDDISSGDTVYTYYPVADIENVVEVADKVYSIFSIAVVTLIGIIFFILISRIMRPIEEMNEITGDMASLNFERKCGNYGNDEVGELGNSINVLSDKLDSTLEDLKDKNEQLRKDIQMRLALDNARKSFISNVSHELKTPIAIISGYAEGICEDVSTDAEATKEYCGIIRDESNKMNELVLELLELSKLESQSWELEPDFYDIGEEIGEILEHLSLKTREEGITVVNNVSESLECFAQGDKIEIVIKNYINNAISHCSGDKVIIINAKKHDGFVKISVFNTGEHISDEDMPEIWDSFYRADKAHKRSENRFGLGLSIVKSIMEHHKCRYGAENVKGGVRFYFEVPEGPDYYEKN